MELLPLYAAVFSTVSSTTSEVSYCALHLQRINLKPTFRAVTLGVWGTSEEALSIQSRSQAPRSLKVCKRKKEEDTESAYPRTKDTSEQLSWRVSTALQTSS